MQEEDQRHHQIWNYQEWRTYFDGDWQLEVTAIRDFVKRRKDTLPTNPRQSIGEAMQPRLSSEAFSLCTCGFIFGQSFAVILTTPFPHSQDSLHGTNRLISNPEVPLPCPEPRTIN